MAVTGNSDVPETVEDARALPDRYLRVDTVRNSNNECTHYELIFGKQFAKEVSPSRVSKRNKKRKAKEVSPSRVVKRTQKRKAAQ